MSSPWESSQYKAVDGRLNVDHDARSSSFQVGEDDGDHPDEIDAMVEAYMAKERAKGARARN